MIKKYFRGLYQRTMNMAYARAEAAIEASLREGGRCLDCGATDGYRYHQLASAIGLPKERYMGVEWNPVSCAQARGDGLDVMRGDLNQVLTYDDNQFRCVIALSVLEHLIYGCRFLRESYRVLEPGGTLVILTPNISTYFTAALILLGKMPSSGPHPDSDALLSKEELFRVRDASLIPDVESDTPVHRHLVVFSYRALKKYLLMVGFSEIRGYGFGVYPFPNFMQRLLERLDPWHSHQMVFVATKAKGPVERIEN